MTTFFNTSNYTISDELSNMIHIIERDYSYEIAILKMEFNSKIVHNAQFSSRKSEVIRNTIKEIIHEMQQLSWEDQIMCCACSKHPTTLIPYLDYEQLAAYKLLV